VKVGTVRHPRGNKRGVAVVRGYCDMKLKRKRKSNAVYQQASPLNSGELMMSGFVC
jgi:hypothetical protein